MHTHFFYKNNQQDTHMSLGAGIALSFPNILSLPMKPLVFYLFPFNKTVTPLITVDKKGNASITKQDNLGKSLVKMHVVRER